MKKILGLFISLTLIFNVSTASSSPLDNYLPQLTATAQQRFGVDTDRFISVIDGSDSRGTYSVFSGAESGIQTASIVPTFANPQFLANLLPCKKSNLKVCIESVSYRNVSRQNWIEAQLVENKILTRTGQLGLSYPNGNTQEYGYFGENIALNRPAGGDASIWSMTEASHKGGAEYLVSVYISTFPRGLEKSPFDLNAGIQPIRVTVPDDVRQYQFPNNVRQYQFPEGFEYRLKIRLGELLPKVTKWYSALLKSPQIEIDGEFLNISGEPVKVPLARSIPMKCEVLPSEKRSALAASLQLDLFNSSCEKSGVGISAHADIFDNGKSGFQVFQVFEKELFEIGKNSKWSLTANSDLGECSSIDVSGFISSNAMLFTPNPPTFDKQNQTLIYQMASPHLDNKGVINTGNLDLVLRKTVAKCLWKTENLNLNQALVTITYADGTSRLGTSTLKTTEDWIYLNVTNFSFSNPTIRINLSPAASEENKVPNPMATSSHSPNAIPTPTSVVSPKSTPSTKKPLVVKTTCIKGKITKVVTGTKCPAGYKKK